MATLARRRLVAGGIASVALAGAIGTTMLVAHGSTGATSAPLSTTTASPTAATASPSPTAKPGHHHAAGVGLIGKVQTVTASALTIVDAKGVTHTLTVAPRTKVTGPDGAEVVTSIPAGELVVVEARSAHPKAVAGGSTPTGTASGDAQMIAARIRDTGFKGA